MNGLVVKFYKKSHGRKPYGFISGYDGESYYFNSKSLLTEVHEGDEVKFRASFNNQGNFAREVQIITSEERQE